MEIVLTEMQDKVQGAVSIRCEVWSESACTSLIVLIVQENHASPTGHGKVSPHTAALLKNNEVDTWGKLGMAFSFFMFETAFTIQILQDFVALCTNAALTLQKWKPWQSLGKRVTKPRTW